jgi:cytochrome c-type biogenesis protein CcmH/NrfF
MLFIGVGVMLLLERADVVDSDLRWLPPVVLVVIGIALLVTSAVRAATSNREATEIDESAPR